MPRIFDNIEKPLLPALQETLQVAERADFCVGYFNLRGWRHLAGHVNRWAGGDGQCCRLLVGMHVTPSDELRQILRTRESDDGLDAGRARWLRRLARRSSWRAMACCCTSSSTRSKPGKRRRGGHRWLWGRAGRPANQ